MQTVTSKDGTKIAFEKIGSGPVVILVDAALADRTSQQKMAAILAGQRGSEVTDKSSRLAARFTVISYDRRGRGDSGDTQPYAPEREVEDIAALVDAVGAPVMFYGGSSGAALAVAASNALGDKVRRQVLFEPPYVVDDQFPPVSHDLGERIAALAAAGKRTQAAKLFFSETMHIPLFGLFMMQLMPMWPKIKTLAHTTPYDIAVLCGLQDGKPLPPERFAGVTAATLVLTGAKSEPFFHTAADALAGLLPDAEHRKLEGVDHGTPFMKPQQVADLIADFLAA